MRETLRRLVSGEELSREETRGLLIGITEGRFPPEQVTALIMGLQMRGVSVDELLGLRDGVLATGVDPGLEEYHALDVVGTGGDGKNTFNISTCAAFVVAATGRKVAKHGNYAATSVSGASNVIEAHGARLTNDAERLRRSLDGCNMAYLHAPLFATALKHVAPIRKALGIPTCFNLLGPLVNPARPAAQLLGVASLNQMRLYSNVYQRLGIRYGIVNSLDGYDEVSLTGEFKFMGHHLERVFKPGDLGLPEASSDEISGRAGQGADVARRVFDDVLANRATPGQTNVVLANAAFALKVDDPARELGDCLAEAREALASGRAWQTLEKFVEINSRP